jgi:hypothetical protein
MAVVEDGALRIDAEGHIEQNEAVQGGGVFSIGSLVALLGRVSLQSNHADYGGVIFALSSQVIVGGRVNLASNEAAENGVRHTARDPDEDLFANVHLSMLSMRGAVLPVNSALESQPCVVRRVLCTPSTATSRCKTARSGNATPRTRTEAQFSRKAAP